MGKTDQLDIEATIEKFEHTGQAWYAYIITDYNKVPIGFPIAGRDLTEEQMLNQTELAIGKKCAVTIKNGQIYRIFHPQIGLSTGKCM